ncbi:hypothetical protein IFM89_009453 [Coptis chinensis]|uniref:Uncharacterized protein n=1 Tax=Coptis chinensis TaxID=261450 RepID=A0A835M255_9MAGN|nr:hypothetical protein IFM89_009453 [Coptis chinensis]
MRYCGVLVCECGAVAVGWSVCWVLLLGGVCAECCCWVLLPLLVPAATMDLLPFLIWEVDNLILESQVSDNPSLFLTRKKATSIVGCLMQAVGFVCLVLLAFHQQPDEHGEVLDWQVPVTSIRLEISGFPSFGRRFIFVLYNFVEVSRRRSRQGQGVMYTGISKESSYVDMSLSCSSCNKKPKRILHFLLPFAAAPTFFLSLHLKLFMAKNVASFNFCNPMLLLEDDISLSNEGDLATFQKCLKNELTVVETLLGNQDSGKSVNNDIVELKSHSGHLSGSEQCAENSRPPVAGGHSFLENRGKECFSHLNDIKIQVPAVNHVESSSCDGERQEAHQSTSDSVWSVNDFAIRSPNPTTPRSLWHHNRHSSGSLSFGYRSKIWPDGMEELSPNGFVNGSSKPKNQASCLLPFGSYDFSSKPRSHQRRGPRRPRRIRTDIEKTVPKGSRSPQRCLELLSCYANLLSTARQRVERMRGYQFDGGKSKKQTKIIAPQSNDHAHLKLFVKELDGFCGAALGFIVSEAITNT